MNIDTINEEIYSIEWISIDFDQNTSDITGFFQDDREFVAIGLQNAAAIVDIETFKDVLNSKRPNPYIFITDAAHGSNSGLFSLTM